MKILFFHVPALGMYNSIEAVLLELVDRGHTVVHYNYEGFRRYVDESPIRFKPYRAYQGYHPNALTSSMNVYDLGLQLLDTAEHTIDFVESEVLRESPDAVLHSKFLVAAKAVANTHRVSAACLTTGFVFHPSVVLQRPKPRSSSVNLSTVASFLEFKRRARIFYQRHAGASTDPNDVFVNEESLNLVLGLEVFQPSELRNATKYRFVGPTVQVRNYAKSYDLIYVSLGSTFVDNMGFFQTCIQALKGVGRRAIISLSDRFSPAQFGDVPPEIELMSFVSQKEVLQRAALFITHGGGNSVYESLYCATPMIVVPQITDQWFYARRIEALGLGRYIDAKDLTVDVLQSMITDVLENAAIARNVRAFKDALPKIPPAVTACNDIEELLSSNVAST